MRPELAGGVIPPFTEPLRLSVLRRILRDMPKEYTGRAEPEPEPYYQPRPTETGWYELDETCAVCGQNLIQRYSRMFPIGRPEGVEVTSDTRCRDRCKPAK